MENAFDILGISMAQAKIISQLSQNRRQSCLNYLRRYFSLFLHPDIEGAPHSAMTRINAALDAINTDSGFKRALEEYKKFGPRKGGVSGSSADVLNEQLKYEISRHANAEKSLKHELANKDRTIKEQELSISKLNRLIFRAEQETGAKFRRKIQKLRENLLELGTAKWYSESRLSACIFNLIEFINKIAEYQVPEGAIPTRDLAGMNIRQIRAVLKVDKNLNMTRSIKTTSGIVRRVVSGTLVGSIYPEIIRKERMLSPSSSAFHDCLSNLKFYLQKGMRPVSTKYGNLYIYGPTIKIEKDEGD